MPTIERERLLRVLFVLALASAFCGALLGTRIVLTHHLTLVFLGWNLVLAWVPLLLSLLIAARAPSARPATLVTGVAWLAFFPNAPYLVTDLIHVRDRGFVLHVYDAILVFAFALTGVCLAFVSLWLMHRLVERALGRALGWLFVAAVAGLSGFGVFAGRFLRWNSWDLVTRPAELLSTLASGAQDPLSHVGALGVTAVMGGLIAATYAMFFALTSLGAAPGAYPAASPPTMNESI